MHSTSISAVAANLADTFASRFSAAGDVPPAAHAALADALAWVNDDEANDLESYPGPQWSDPDAYDPTPSDWQEYAAWSRSLDGGCGVTELSPEERDLIMASMSADEYWDAIHEYEQIMAERDAESWA
jgi:hypothetical protein